MHAAEHDRPIDLAKNMLRVGPCRRALSEAGHDKHLLFAPFFSLGDLPPGLQKRVVQESARTRECSGPRSIHGAASSPDPITG